MALTDNLVAYWKLDESSGNASDSVGSATLTNSNVSYSSGKINNGADFNGSTSNFTTGADTAALDITSNLSITFWFKSSSSSASMHMIEKMDETGYNYRGYLVFMASGKIGFGVGNNSGYPQALSTSTYNDGNWHFLSCVYIPSTSITIYVDNSKDGELTSGVPSAITNNSKYFNVGRRNDGFGPDRYYSGSLDEIGVFSRSISTGEISSLYNSGSGLQYPFSTTSIKTINGLSRSSVKTVGGLAIANLKSFNGLQ